MIMLDNLQTATLLLFYFPGQMSTTLIPQYVFYLFVSLKRSKNYDILKVNIKVVFACQ